MDDMRPIILECPKLKFRLLKANEIDCRVGTINDRGLTLLLYKDARVDQNILDETVGSLNWKRSHEVIGGNLYCTVSIWDYEKKQWISKQDVGVESYTEKEKGQASDSFKRACFNFGIGRELYSAPFIWISAENANIQSKGSKYICKDNFYVEKINYDDEKSISDLAIKNDKNKRVFLMKGRKIYKISGEITKLKGIELNNDRL